MLRFSIAIPTHDMKNKAVFLRRSLDAIKYQQFKDFEVVITDDSRDDALEKICWEYNLKINYSRNDSVLGMAGNSNQAIKKSQGELVKILYLDDYLLGNDALWEINKKFRKDSYWLVTGCAHTVDGEELFNPYYASFNDKIYTGNNTIGSPSVLTIRNDESLPFDETLTWLLDCDLYMRYYKKYGRPVILDSLGVVIYQGDHQVTNILSDEIKIREQDYLLNKYQ